MVTDAMHHRGRAQARPSLHWIKGAAAIMVETAKKNGQALIIPLALVGTIVGVLLAGGKAMFWAGEHSHMLAVEKAEREKLETKVEQLGERRAAVDQVTFDRQVQTAAQVIVQTRELDRQERELRLLRDFVEGRMGPMPYRKTKARDTEDDGGDS